MTDTTPTHRATSPRYVNEDPWDANAVEALTPAQEKFYLANQWTLMWWKFRRHKLAVWSGVLLIMTFGSILISRNPGALQPAFAQHRLSFMPRPRWCASSTRASLVRPFVYGFDYRLDMETLERSTRPTRTRCSPSGSSAWAIDYEFWGLIDGSFPHHLSRRGRHAVPSGHRPAGPRHALAHSLWRAHFAHRRPDSALRSASCWGSSWAVSRAITAAGSIRPCSA